MKKYSITIAKDAHEIFEFLTNKDNFKKWATHLVEIIPEDPNKEIGVGYKFIEKDSFLGIKREFHDEVFEFEKDKVIAIKSNFKDKVLKFRYKIGSLGDIDEGTYIVVAPILDESLNQPQMLELEETKSPHLETIVILEVWAENIDGHRETLGERALDYFVVREGIHQLKNLKKLLEK